MLRPNFVVILGAVALGTAMVTSTDVASAQTPWPHFSITGVVDTVITGGSNAFDGNFASASDAGVRARERIRLRLTHEIEPLRLKEFLELQADVHWRDVGGLGAEGTTRFGFHDDDPLHVRYVYVEFPAPWPPPMPYSTLRLGIQLFDATLKPSVLLTDDFAGLWLRSELTDRLTLELSYAALDVADPAVLLRDNRGADSVVALSLTFEIPHARSGTFARLRPLWAFLAASGLTEDAARCRIQCAGLPANKRGGGYFPLGGTEHRHYIALDAELQWEAEFHFEPTFIYMISTADTAGNAATLAQLCGDKPCPIPPGTRRQQMLARSWLLDVRGGWRCRLLAVNCEALHVETLAMWTPGDASHHNLFRKNRVYHPIGVHQNYLLGWNEILAPGSVDYLTGIGHGMSENIGLGRYGRIQIGTRVSYTLWRTGYEEAIVSFKGSSAWTDQEVDTDAVPLPGANTPAYGNVPCAIANNCRPGNNQRGDARYIGTELSLGFTYRLALGLTFDVVGAYLFAGSALDSATRSARDAQLVAGRVRFQF